MLLKVGLDLGGRSTGHLRDGVDEDGFSDAEFESFVVRAELRKIKKVRASEKV
jgi:hypothetical protein